MGNSRLQGNDPVECGFPVFGRLRLRGRSTAGEF